ncbi:MULTISPECIES: hypothetical protein [unclassified Brevundimonas]|uniref:hypothetical protein n=1 Tax=unclassified Brevundimonas TaxID=2622653 RepID=UPI0025BF1E10|nr:MULTISPECIES: hypothetical protein [unclassified Brevundimonas]
MILLAALAAVCFATSTPSNAQDCYESTIRTPSPFMGNHNEIFRLQDGTLWQVQHEYEYLYEYYPTVVVCPSRGSLIIDDKRLSIRHIDGSIESKIDGEFSGWEGDTVFKLTNGQIWQQAEHDYKYRYAYSPDVVIFRADGRFMMQVEGMDKPIRVIRLR